MGTSATRGQAMIECAVCLFAFALVLSALLAFGAIIPRATRLLSDVRRDAGRAAQAGSAGEVGALPPVLNAALPTALQTLPPVALATKEDHETVDLPTLAGEYLFEVNAAGEYRLHEAAALPAFTVPTFDAPAFTAAEGDLL